MVLTREMKEYFSSLVEPLAKSSEIDQLLKRLEEQEVILVYLKTANEEKDRKIEAMRLLCRKVT